jgi:vacuolar-type H+-ATPase subunit I/STV1
MKCTTDRRHAIELTIWFTVYAGLLFASLELIDRGTIGAPALRAIVALTPMIAGFGILATIMRQYRRTDELGQRVTAEAIMFAFGATAIVTFSYGFLQRAGVAPQDASYFWVWAIMGAAWMLGSLIARRRYQ